ncbi:hypothetical protein Tco_0459252 [Tanacetum coccineum]
MPQPQPSQHYNPTTIIQSELHETTNANPEDITDPPPQGTWASLSMAKAFQTQLLNTIQHTTREFHSNPLNRQIAHPGCSKLQVQNLGCQNMVIQNGHGCSEYWNVLTKEMGCCLSSDSVVDCSNGRRGIQLQAEGQATHRYSDDNAPRSMIQTDQLRQGGTVDQHPATVEETRAYFESLYNNLALEVEKEIDASLESSCQSRLMSIVQKSSAGRFHKYPTLELDRTEKNVLKNCIIKKEKELCLNFGMIGTRNVKNANMTNRVDNMLRTRSPQPRSNTKIDRGSPLASKSSLQE